MADINSAIKHIEGSLKSEDNGMCYILQSRLWHIRHLLKKQQEEIKHLQAENERLKQEKADAVKRIERCRQNCISGEKDCDSALDREGKEINRAKAYAYQWVLNIINRPSI